MGAGEMGLGVCQRLVAYLGPLGLSVAQKYEMRIAGHCD